MVDLDLLAPLIRDLLRHLTHQSTSCGSDLLLRHQSSLLSAANGFDDSVWSRGRKIVASSEPGAHASNEAGGRDIGVDPGEGMIAGGLPHLQQLWASRRDVVGTLMDESGC
jgi:hypothetical protein